MASLERALLVCEFVDIFHIDRCLHSRPSSTQVLATEGVESTMEGAQARTTVYSSLSLRQMGIVAQRIQCGNAWSLARIFLH